MSEYVAITVALLFLYVYAVLSSIEFGAAIFQLWPRLLVAGGGSGNGSSDSDDARGSLKGYFGPVWEVTTVFLVTFIVMVFTLFPGATEPLGTALLVNLFVALVLFGVRTVCMLLIFYTENSDHVPVNILFLLSSFATPVALSTPLAFMLTSGEAGAAATPVYWTLGALVAAGVVLVSSSFFRFYAAGTGSVSNANTRAMNLLVRCASAGWMVAAALYVASVWIGVAHVQLVGIAGILGLTGTAAGTAIFVYAERRAKFLMSFIASCVLLASVFFASAFAQLPYILYPNVTIQNSFTGDATYRLFMLALIVGLAVTVPALVWLHRMFTFGKK